MLLSQEFQNFIVQLRANPVPLGHLTDMNKLRATFDALGSDQPHLPDVMFRPVDAAGCLLSGSNR